MYNVRLKCCGPWSCFLLLVKWVTNLHTELQPECGTCIDGLRNFKAVILKVQDVGLRDVELLPDCCQIIDVTGRMKKHDA